MQTEMAAVLLAAAWKLQSWEKQVPVHVLRDRGTEATATVQLDKTGWQGEMQAVWHFAVSDLFGLSAFLQNCKPLFLQLIVFLKVTDQEILITIAI